MTGGSAKGRVAGKRVAVIGAGSVGPGWGNGKAAAVLFAREGGHVLAVDRDLAAAEETAAIIRDEGGSAEVLAVDLTAEGAAATVRDTAAERLGGLDILHFNIGISTRGGVEDTPMADWRRVFEVNLDSAFVLTQTLLPLVEADGGGALVFVSTLAAQRNGPYPYVAYEASKAALCRLSRSIAVEYAARGVRSNTVVPGLIDTPHVLAHVDKGPDVEAIRSGRAAMVPMKRQGTGWDVANAAVFLASDAAGFITGVDLRVDGGMALLMGNASA
ncbi:SDR family NAD(P)-dependent oxidoreductase [Acuticoccus sediminis]|uniref:SDR family NAD(P)-dependent oxidoreductase n=1 Tax=Acuticoccus sediminis TaxID=2184697 RepID=UPI001CFDE4DF|nr:SDR family oxidoreductase [Acuticoccus sediminis]